MAKKKPEKGQERRRYVIGARKIAAEHRDVAGPVLAQADASYMDIMYSNDDPAVGLGADVAYAADLTEEEAERFREASNCRYVELDQFSEQRDVADSAPADPAGLASPAAADAVIPPASELAFMGASLAQQGMFTGNRVKVGVLDGGTSPAMRARFTWTMIARRNFNTQVGDTPLRADETMFDGSTETYAMAVPPGAQLIDAMVCRSPTSVRDSDMAAGLIWAADQGAEVILYCWSKSLGAPGTTALYDALNAMRARGVQLFSSVGNNSTNQFVFPASETVNYANVHAIVNWNQATDNIAPNSNYGSTASGALSGTNVTTMGGNGVEVVRSGTLYAAAKGALLTAMLTTGGAYTAQQSADALKASARNTGDPVSQQGKGAWELDNAIAYLAPQTVPSGSLQLAQTIVQPIAHNVETKVRYQTIRQYSDDVTVNLAHDTVTIRNPGLYLLTASCRWIGFPNTTGDKLIAIGNNVPWTDTATKRWKTDSRRGTNAAMGQTIAHVQRFEVGDQVCVWANQSSGITWNLEPTIGVPPADPATFTVTRISA